MCYSTCRFSAGIDEYLVLLVDNDPTREDSTSHSSSLEDVWPANSQVWHRPEPPQLRSGSRPKVAGAAKGGRQFAVVIGRA